MRALGDRRSREGLKRASAQAGLSPRFEAIRRLITPCGRFAILRHGKVEAHEHRFYWADPNFFQILPLPAVAGDLKTSAFERPDDLVLTRRMARKYFGRDPPAGETLGEHSDQPEDTMLRDGGDGGPASEHPSEYRSLRIGKGPWIRVPLGTFRAYDRTCASAHAHLLAPHACARVLQRLPAMEQDSCGPAFGQKAEFAAGSTSCPSAPFIYANPAPLP